MIQQYLVLKKKCILEAKELLVSRLPELLEPAELEVAIVLLKDAVTYHKRCFKDMETDAAERTDIQ